MNKSEEQKGTIVCTRVVSYNEVSHLIKKQTVQEAVSQIMKDEQNKWKMENSIMLEDDSGNKSTNLQFFRDCFPKWTYYLGETQCTPEDAVSAVKSGVVWDVELKVEHGPKLEAYKLLKKEKE